MLLIVKKATESTSGGGGGGGGGGKLFKWMIHVKSKSVIQVYMSCGTTRCAHVAASSSIGSWSGKKSFSSATNKFRKKAIIVHYSIIYFNLLCSSFVPCIFILLSNVPYPVISIDYFL